MADCQGNKTDFIAMATDDEELREVRLQLF